MKCSGLKSRLRLNTVVIKDFNTDELTAIAEIARDNSIEVRFIEQMPFNGKSNSIKFISAKEILNILQGSISRNSQFALE